MVPLSMGSPPLHLLTCILVNVCLAPSAHIYVANLDTTPCAAFVRALVRALRDGASFFPGWRPFRSETDKAARAYLL